VPLFRRKEPQAVPAGPPVTVAVIEDTHSYEGDDGHTYWSIGFSPVHEDADGGYHFLRLGEPLPDARAIYCKVAGVQHHEGGIRGGQFTPVAAAKLVPEPDNPHDPNAVGVWDADGAIQAGYLPADVAVGVAARMRSGEQMVGMVVREIRQGSKSGKRSGLHMVLIPPCTFKLKIIEDD